MEITAVKLGVGTDVLPGPALEVPNLQPKYCQTLCYTEIHHSKVDAMALPNPPKWWELFGIARSGPSLTAVDVSQKTGCRGENMYVVRWFGARMGLFVGLLLIGVAGLVRCKTAVVLLYADGKMEAVVSCRTLTVRGCCCADN